MQTIQAFKCRYCGKVYENSNSCISHEYKCFFNPNTKSCASCAFKIYQDYCMPNGNFTKIRTCILNVDITGKLKTKCDKYLNVNDPEAIRCIQHSKNSYFPSLVISKHIDRIMKIPSFTIIKEADKEMKEELCECYYGLSMNHLMVTILQKVRLKSDYMYTDKDIETYFENYLHFQKLAVSMFYHLGFEVSRINSTINNVADNWHLNAVLLSKIEISGLFALLNNGARINDLLSHNEKKSKAFEIFNLIDIPGLKDLVSNQQFTSDNPHTQGYLKFESIVKSIDPSFTSNLEISIAEIVNHI